LSAREGEDHGTVVVTSSGERLLRVEEDDIRKAAYRFGSGSSQAKGRKGRRREVGQGEREERMGHLGIRLGYSVR
jgi:hypothetical protein